MRETRVRVQRTPVRTTARFVARHPRSTGSVVMLSSAVLWAGYQAVLVAAGTAVVAGASWRVLDQPTFDRFAGRLLRAWRRRWLVYQRQWDRVAFACNLTTTDHRGETLKPKLRRVRSTWVWDSLHIRLAQGQEPQHFEQALEQLTNAYKARSGSIRQPKPGMVALDLQRREPFDEMLIPLPAMADSVDSVDLGHLPMGRDEYGRDFALDLLQRDLHILFGGETGAGKGSYLWGLLRAVAPLIRAGQVRLWVIDPKGGMEFGAGRTMFHRFADNEHDGLAVLREYIDTLDATKLRLGREGIRTATPSQDTPLEVLVCDELAALTAYGSRDVVRAVGPLLSKALTQYRAVLGRVLAATQEPTKDTVPMRGLFPTKIALRLDAPSYVDMCLGEGMRDKGAFADKIPTYLPGVAYIKQDSRREPLRVRAAYTSDDDITELVQAVTEHRASVTRLHGERADHTTTPEPGDAVLGEVEEVDFTTWEDDLDEIEEITEADWDDEDDIA